MNTKNGAFRQRVGYLIEQYICEKYKLFYNKRQRTQGYYDAYDDKTIYEIKASNNKNNTFMIRLHNHKQLVLSNGSYIFITYKLRNKDKDLSVISDIELIQIKIIKASDINVSKKKTCVGSTTNPKKKYIRIYLSEIRTLGDNKI